MVDVREKKVALVIGCGGVGSNLAYLLAKDEDYDRIILVDGDKTEPKNLERQFFIPQDVDVSKADALRTTLIQFMPNKEFISRNMFIEKIDDLNWTQPLTAGRIVSIFICTDNLKSKRLLDQIIQAGYVNGMDRRRFVVGCDRGVVQISNNTKTTTWTVGDGYSSTQNFESNIAAAFIAYLMDKNDWLPVKQTKIQLVKLASLFSAGNIVEGDNE